MTCHTTLSPLFFHCRAMMSSSGAIQLWSASVARAWAGRESRAAHNSLHAHQSTSLLHAAQTASTPSIAYCIQPCLRCLAACLFAGQRPCQASRRYSRSTWACTDLWPWASQVCALVHEASAAQRRSACAQPQKICSKVQPRLLQIYQQQCRHGGCRHRTGGGCSAARG